jgi:hypothetical protein
MELEELTEGMKERVPTEDEDPREAPHEPLRPSVLEKRFWRGRAAGRRCLGEREGSLRRRQRFKDLNSPRPVPDRTLSGATGHCPGGLDFVW